MAAAEVVYLSVAFTPATGAVESGRWSTRALLEIPSGLSGAGLMIIGADVAEFTPVYDNAAKATRIVVGKANYEMWLWVFRIPVKKLEGIEGYQNPDT